MNAFVNFFLSLNVNSLQFNLKNAFLHKYLSKWIHRLLKDGGTFSVFNLINTTKSTLNVKSARCETPSVLTHHRLYDK